MQRLLPAATLTLLFVAISLTLTPSALAYKGHGGNDRASVGNDITINEGETVGDVACAFCSVHLHGDVKGDVAVLFGSVTMDEDRSISGDVAILGGDLSVPDGSSIGGDLALAAGELNLSSEGTIHGDRMVLPGRLWLLIPFAPLLIVIGIIWLLVHFIRRNRYPHPGYPSGRRF